MGQHKITYESNFPYGARCRCGWHVQNKVSMQTVDDEVFKHEADIEKLRLRLGTSTPSLKAQRDYYREKAEAEDTPEQDRWLWQQLARELDHRVNDTPSTQDELPFN